MSFDRDKIIFLQDNVGVITNGSIRIRSHENGVLTPFTVGKYKEGQIIGHGESDNNITTHSQTWFLAFEPNTEVVFFPKAVFNQLWKKQKFNTQHTILAEMLRNNVLFKHLSEQTIYALVFDVATVKKYRPGQLICRMSKRSAMNKL